MENKLTDIDIKLLRALQEDLPVQEKPYSVIAMKTGIPENEVIEKIRQWKQDGSIRRFGVLLAHRRAGISANGMVVWNAPEDKIEDYGVRFAQHQAVSHCYARPVFEGWSYRLYTMVHGKTRDQVEAIAADLSKSVGLDDYFILYSTREFKKSDTRLFFEDDDA